MVGNIPLIKDRILRRLFKMGKIGGAHTSAFHLSSSLPDDIIRNKKSQKEIQQAIKELVNEGFLLSYPSTNEQHVSLNPRKIKEIKEFLKI